MRSSLTLGGEFLAAMGAAAGQDLAAAGSGHARAEAVAALAHDFARLIGALHGAFLNGKRARFLWLRGGPVNLRTGMARNKITGEKGQIPLKDRTMSWNPETYL